MAQRRFFAIQERPEELDCCVEMPARVLCSHQTDRLGARDMSVQVAEPEVETRTRFALEVAELFPPQGQWTEEAYFSLPETNRYMELSEGELIMPPHPTNTHQRIVGDLYYLLRRFVEERDLGVIRIAPLPVRLWPGKIREPDILFVAKEHADRIGERCFGVPDLVVEVTSSSTWRTDRWEKLWEYAQAGVQEYWIVDPDAGSIEVYRWREGTYELVGKWGRGERARSVLLPGFEVSVDDVVG